MSETNELLDGLENESISTYASEKEPHIVIGRDRTITVPNELKRIAVQFDHNIETVTFDCPRYWDGLDMSQMAIYINYLRSDGELGSCPADNIVIDETDKNMMHFDWTVSGNVTEVNGSLTFLVCIRNTDDENNVENHWNSELNTDMYVSEGLDVNTETIAKKYPDVISSILTRMSRNETAITIHKEKTVLDHPDGCVTNKKLSNGSVSGNKIQNGVITYEKLSAEVRSAINSGGSSSGSGVTYGASAPVSIDGNNNIILNYDTETLGVKDSMLYAKSQLLKDAFYGDYMLMDLSSEGIYTNNKAKIWSELQIHTDETQTQVVYVNIPKTIFISEIGKIMKLEYSELSKDLNVTTYDGTVTLNLVSDEDGTIHFDIYDPKNPTFGLGSSCIATLANITINGSKITSIVWNYPVVDLSSENLYKALDTKIYTGICITEENEAVKEVTTINGDFELKDGAVININLNSNIKPLSSYIKFNIDGTGDVAFCPNGVDEYCLDIYPSNEFRFPESSFLTLICEQNDDDFTFVSPTADAYLYNIFDKKIHKEKTVLDHPDGCVTWDKLASDVQSTINNGGSLSGSSEITDGSITIAKLDTNVLAAIRAGVYCSKCVTVGITGICNITVNNFDGIVTDGMGILIKFANNVSLNSYYPLSLSINSGASIQISTSDSAASTTGTGSEVYFTAGEMVLFRAVTINGVQYWSIQYRWPNSGNSDTGTGSSVEINDSASSESTTYSSSKIENMFDDVGDVGKMGENIFRPVETSSLYIADEAEHKLVNDTTGKTHLYSIPISEGSTYYIENAVYVIYTSTPLSGWLEGDTPATDEYTYFAAGVHSGTITVPVITDESLKYVYMFVEPYDTSKEVIIRELKDTDVVAAVNRVIDDVADIKIYSTTPVKVGTWLDGTPIWRWAFDRAQDEDEKNDKCVLLTPPLVNTSDAFVVNSFVRVYSDHKNVNTIDGCMAAYNGSTGWYWDYPYVGFDYVYGWIEFATPKSNIKT